MLILLLAACSPISVVFGAEAIISQTIAGASNGSTGDQTLGWRFHLKSPVFLTSLGVYDHLQDGFAEAHQVGLWTSTGTLLGSGNLPVGASGNLLGSFRYVDVPSVPLPIGDYVIGAHFIGTFVDPFSDFNSSLTTDPIVEYMGRNSDGPGFQFPSNFLGTDGLNFITSNLQFSLVPEPSALVLAGLGTVFAVMSRRRKF